MKINPRFEALIKEIDGHTLADIGCDHGIISINVILDNKIEKVIATDISDKSLNKCRLNAKKNNIDDRRIDFRCGDGFSVIKDDEVDIALIAGMGGIEIISILKNIPKGVKKLVLSPHSDTTLLRDFLVENSLKIDKDYIVRDGKFFYSIIVATYGKDSLSEKERYFGRDSFKNEDYVEYLDFLYIIYLDVLTKATNKEKIDKYTKLKELIEIEKNESK